MAERPDDDLSDAISALSVMDDDFSAKGLDKNVRAKLEKIKTDYEGVFSWDIKRLTGNNTNLLSNVLDKVREKYDLVIFNENTFNVNRFYMKLIICYELYVDKCYEESLLEIENVMKSMECNEFDYEMKRYKYAFAHIAQATYAYVALTLNRDYEKIIKDIKPVNSLNQAEKSAICAVKARVFMEYPIVGNEIALKLADEARKLEPNESEWIMIWLKAKGRVRRYYNHYEMPDMHETFAAELLSALKSKPRALIQASKHFKNVANCHKTQFNSKESNKYYKISSELIMEALGLANDNVHILYSSLMAFTESPKQFQSQTVIDEILEKLINVKNSRVDHILGNYFFKHEKNYEKAKIYFSRSFASGHFYSALQLVKVECLLQPVEKFSFVQTIDMIYNVFLSPKRRLILLSQILMYYYYYDNNPKQVMHYLKLYMDQDIDETFKKRCLIYAYPSFKVNGYFKPKRFFYLLSASLENITVRYEWSKDEKEIVDDTMKRFNKLSIIKIEVNQNSDNNRSGFRERIRNNNSRYPNKYAHNNRNNEQNWRKYQGNSSKNEVYGKQNTLNDDKSYQYHESMNNNLSDPNYIDAKLKKFESQNKYNMHSVPFENNSTDNKLSSYGKCGRSNNRPPQIRQERSQNSEAGSLFKNNSNDICDTYKWFND